MIAEVRIHPHSHIRDAVKHPVDGPQRADKPAEGPVPEDAAEPDYQHDHKLPGKENPQHRIKLPVARMGKKAHGTIESARRTDILAEARHRHAVKHPVPEGNRNDKHRENHILQTGENPGNPVLFSLRGRNLVKKLLQKPQGTEPSADGSSEACAEEQKYAEHIPADSGVGGRDGILQGTERTGPHGTRTGIAVKSGHTERLGLSRIDLTFFKAPQMGIIEQRTVELHQFSFCRTVDFPPGFLTTQVQYTPYRY